MDKYEYRIKTEQMVKLVNKKDYKTAMKIADTIDWRRVKSVAMLCTVSEIYEKNRRYEESREVLLIAYDRAPIGRMIVYRLAELALKMGDMNEAIDCYEEFVHIAPRDSGRYILEYKILRSRKAPIEKQIAVLEQLKKVDYHERWAYELARLYEESGRLEECIELCDELALWFSEGEFVIRALELKSKYQPLSAIQQETYRHRNEAGSAAVYKEPVSEFSAETPVRPSIKPSVEPSIEAAVPREEIDVPVMDMQSDWTENIGATDVDEPETEAFHLPEQDEKMRTFYIPDEVLHPEQKRQREERERTEQREPRHSGLFDKFFNREKEKDKDKEQREYPNFDEIQLDLFRDEPDYSAPHYEEPKKEPRREESSYRRPQPDEPQFAVPPVNVGKFDTMNLQAELAKSMAELLGDEEAFVPQTQADVSETDEEAKKREQLLHAQTKKIADTEGQGKLLGNTKEFVPLFRRQTSANRQQPRNVKDFRNMLSEDYDGQISLFIEEAKKPEKQITGQMNIDEILAEWNKTKQVTEEAIAKAARKKEAEEKAQEPVPEEPSKIPAEIRDLLNELEAESQDSLWSLRGKKEQQSEAEPAPEEEAPSEPEEAEEESVDEQSEAAQKPRPAGPVVRVESALPPEVAVERSLNAAAAALERAVRLGAKLSGKDEAQKADTAYEQPAQEYAAASETAYVEEPEPMPVEEEELSNSVEPDDDRPHEDRTEEELFAELENGRGAAAYEPVRERFSDARPQRAKEEDLDPATALAREVSAMMGEREPDMEMDVPESREPFTESEFGDEEALFEEEPVVEEAPYEEEPERPTFTGKQPETEGRLFEEAFYERALAEQEPTIEEPVSEKAFFEQEEEAEEPKAVQEEIREAAPQAEETEREAFNRQRLTESQRSLFSYFMSVRGMEEHIAGVIYDDIHNDTRKGTSNSGNILIIGRPGAGKTTLAINLVKAIQKERKLATAKLAKASGEALNNKNINDIISKVYGGALLIERAGRMNVQTARSLSQALEGDTGELLVLMEDERKPLTRLIENNPALAAQFTSKLEVPVFMNDELVAFGESYAREFGYKVDDMGVLALYSRIDEMQRQDHAVTVGEVRAIVDEAISRAEKGGLKKVMGSLLKKRKNGGSKKLLMEQDFGVK